MGMTPMISPNGAAGEIPTTRVAEAVKAGFKIGAKLTSPSGRTGAVPLDRVHEAIQAGFQPYVPTEEQANASPAVAPVPLPSQKILGGTFKSALDPNQIPGMAPNAAPLASPVLPAAGAAGQIVSAGGSKAGEYIGEKLNLSPAHVVWASRIGSTLGMFAGAGGEAQAEAIWGGMKNALASKIYNADGELSKFGESLVHPTKLPENALRTIFPPPSDIPAEGTGAPLPNSAEYYENKAADLAKRGREQATLDRQAATASKAAARDASKYYTIGEGQSTSPQAVANLPPASAGAEPAGSGPSTSTGPSAQIEVPGIKPSPSPIVAPGSTPPPIKGSFWSYPEGALRQAVLSGDREAAVVYRMRFNELPPGAKYLTDVSESVIKGLYKSSGGK